MIIWGLDIAPHGTGVAMGDALSPPHSLELQFSGLTRAAAGAAYMRWMRDAMALGAPDLVIYEAPLVKTSETNSAATTFLLMGLAFLTETYCEVRGVFCHSVAVQTWRKMFLGHGFPQDPKKAALEMCATIGWDTGGSHDRAEAIGVWAYGHWMHGDRRAIMSALSKSAVRQMHG